MKVIVLSSGSKGNTTLIITKEAKILIDCGNTCKYICEKLKNINIPPEKIDAILITHTHVDHINGLYNRKNAIGITIYRKLLSNNRKQLYN